MSRRVAAEALTQLNAMCEKLFALPHYHMMKYKRCVELALLTAGLGRVLQSSKGNAVSVSLPKLVSVLRQEAKACNVAREWGKLNHAGYIISQHIAELLSMQAQTGELLVLQKHRHTWLLTKQGAKILLSMLGAKYAAHCTS